MGDLNFDKRAATIAALHSSDMKRSICHEQVVQAMRDAKNVGIELCERDHCTPEERAVTNLAVRWVERLSDTERAVICGLNYDTASDDLITGVIALLTTRKEQGQV